MEQVKLMTNEQEKALLNCLAQEYEPKDNGAARMVYYVSGSDLESCGFEVDSSCQYVVKVAIGLAGINQNNIETNTYREHNNEGAFARIFYLGHYCEIMERVYSIEGHSLSFLREYASRTYEDEEEFIEVIQRCDSDISAELATEIYDVIEGLHYLFGHSNDNGQVGLNAEGRVVAYDYGYDEYSDEQLCSDLTDYYDFESDSIFVAEYLESLVHIIDADNEALSMLEQRLIEEC